MKGVIISDTAVQTALLCSWFVSLFVSLFLRAEFPGGSVSLMIVQDRVILPGVKPVSVQEVALLCPLDLDVSDDCTGPGNSSESQACLRPRSGTAVSIRPRGT